MRSAGFEGSALFRQSFGSQFYAREKFREGDFQLFGDPDKHLHWRKPAGLLNQPHVRAVNIKLERQRLLRKSLTVAEVADSLAESHQDLFLILHYASVGTIHPVRLPTDRSPTVCHSWGIIYDIGVAHEFMASAEAELDKAYAEGNVTKKIYKAAIGTPLAKEIGSWSEKNQNRIDWEGQEHIQHHSGWFRRHWERPVRLKRLTSSPKEHLHPNLTVKRWNSVRNMWRSPDKRSEVWLIEGQVAQFGTNQAHGLV
jgi:hypothetical protein